ncbi:MULTISPECIES: hypothetical protein [Candidatus Nitrosocaldus]|uniref:Uncharacterized protein n=1 Tax=Candidatus Nitrosocaldus cavascurensis TaxID=2058097 RepID=A0A2K5ARF4_9ARCH|nr:MULTISPECIES: hypothetical protein [Candidatus Nitrosocaldus]SPC34207.1 protein of unknown function [Candidatus Nitrosocaldus cavascurensis]
MAKHMITLVGIVIASALLLVYLTLQGYESQASNKPEVRYVQIGKWKCPDTALVTLTGEPLPPVRVPTYIPEGYRPVDCYYYQGTDLEMYFLPEGIDPTAVDAPRYAIHFGAVWHGAEHMKEAKEKIIDRGVEVFYEEKANSQRGDLIQIFEINGNLARGWEAGTKNSLVILDGKVISSEPSSYPAVVSMIDQKELVYYSVGGYVPMSELKKILESLEKP